MYADLYIYNNIMTLERFKEEIIFMNMIINYINKNETYSDKFPNNLDNNKKIILKKIKKIL